ncbi:MAG: glycosyltransferase [Alphaproteobacteria bacterium]|nr:glycosyltransferase [Alphaproteobacteria bacterium]
MKIDYLSASVLPSEKANAVHVMHMAQAFSQHGHAVRLFGKRSAGKKDNEIFGHYGMAPDFALCLTAVALRPSIFFRILAFIRAQKKYRTDIVYGRDLWALLAAAMLGYKVIAEVHQMPLTVAEKLVWKLLLQHKNLQHIVAITHALKSDILADYKFLVPEKIVVAPDAAAEMDWSKIAALSTWPGRQGVLQIGYTGSLHKGRGIEIIEALARLVPEHDFHIVGGTAETSLSNLFYHGYQPHAEMPRYLQKFDILLAPYQPRIEIGTGVDISRWISPMKLFEYMATGKPIICSDLPVLREVLEDGVNALLVSPNDAEAWRRAVLKILDKDVVLETRKKFLQEYTWEKRSRSVLR